jgi:hypothetical protein
MAILFAGFACLCLVIALVAWAFILVAAFQDDVMEGTICFIIPIYGVYYMIFEYSGEYQASILIAFVIGILRTCGFAELRHLAH